jgi:hypothetical protein
MDYVEYGIESSRKISSHFDFGLEIGIEIEQEIYGSDVGVMVPQTHHLIDQQANREQP